VSLTQGRRRQEFGVWTAVGAKRLATLPIHVDISEYLAFLFKKDSLFILHIIKVSRWGSSLDIVQKKIPAKVGTSSVSYVIIVVLSINAFFS
jgi:hypothetical protein